MPTARPTAVSRPGRARPQRHRPQPPRPEPPRPQPRNPGLSHPGLSHPGLSRASQSRTSVSRVRLRGPEPVPRLCAARRPRCPPGNAPGSHTSRTTCRGAARRPRPAGRRRGRPSHLPFPPCHALAGPEPLVRYGALLGDGFGAAQLAGQRLLAVLPGEDPAGWQMMEFNPPAGPPHHPLGRERVERERQRRPGVVHAEHVPAGLVVHHHKVAGPCRPTPVIQAVDPPGHGDQVGSGRHRALHPDGLAGRVQAAHVGLHEAPGPAPVAGRLLRVGEAVREPALLEQTTRGGHGPLPARQPPPSGQRVVHARAEAVVRPRRALAGRRAVQVAHPVPARALQPGAEPGRRAGVKPPRHTFEAELLPALLLSHLALA